MSVAMNLRRLIFAACAVFAFAVAAPISIAGVSVAHAQVSAEFQAALQPYGTWRRHARWGLVWVPAHRPRGWRPYTYGHWVYTDEWGWYWISDREEEDFGWVTYHYGRWVLDRRMGWVWVRGDEWAPAWVNWRRGGDYLGWAPLPPDAVIDDYDAEPAYWIFVQPRYLIDVRVRSRVLPPARTQELLRNTVVVNRTLVPERSRVAVNAGIAPAIVGAAARTPIQTYRVSPRVVAGTQGVTGAVAVRPQDFSRRIRPGGSRFGVTAQKTSTVIKPAASVPKPEPLGKGERGRLGAAPPRAAQPSAGSAPLPQQIPTSPNSSPARPGLRPANEPPLKPQAAPIVAPPSARPGESPPQIKPHRPIAPQTPPPPRLGARSPKPPPPAVMRPAPPPRPIAPASTPVAHPKAPAAKRPVVTPPAVNKPTRQGPKPGEKSDDKN